MEKPGRDQESDRLKTSSTRHTLGQPTFHLQHVVGSLTPGDEPALLPAENPLLLIRDGGSQLSRSLHQCDRAAIYDPAYDPLQVGNELPFRNEDCEA